LSPGGGTTVGLEDPTYGDRRGKSPTTDPWQGLERAPRLGGGGCPRHPVQPCSISNTTTY